MFTWKKEERLRFWNADTLTSEFYDKKWSFTPVCLWPAIKVNQLCPVEEREHMQNDNFLKDRGLIEEQSYMWKSRGKVQRRRRSTLTQQLLSLLPRSSHRSWFSLFFWATAIANAITICMGKVIEQARSASEMLPCPFTCFTLYPSTVASLRLSVSSLRLIRKLSLLSKSIAQNFRYNHKEPPAQ